MQRCRIESLGSSPPRRRLLRWGSLRHAEEAGRRCLTASNYRPEDVRILINTGVHRDDHVCEPANAAYIQHRLDINVEFRGRRTLAFDLLNGACGMLSAAHVVSAQLLAGDAKVGMVVSSEANSDRRPDRSWTYSASGSAVLLDLSPRAATGFGAFAFRTSDAFADLYQTVVSLTEKRGRLLVQRSGDLEHAFLSVARDAVDEVLERDGLSREAIDLVVPAQISPAFLAALPAAIGFRREKVADLTAELPDTHSTSVFLALERLKSMAAVGSGRTVLLLAFGAGVTAGAAVYRF
jgi:3-oxoacyl-[acyl-carrier-protein] synthase-3